VKNPFMATESENRECNQTDTEARMREEKYAFVQSLLPDQPRKKGGKLFTVFVTVAVLCILYYIFV
jgi:hypothetical protein